MPPLWLVVLFLTLEDTMDDLFKQAEDIMAGVHDETTLGTNHPFGPLGDLNFTDGGLIMPSDTDDLEVFDAETQAQLDAIDV